MKPAFIAVCTACLVLSACGRDIGDDCSTNVDCGTGRICDTSQPGGYCTISPCRPDYCPGASICVEFTPDDAYCMQGCEADEECRQGYECVVGFNVGSHEYAGFCDQITPDAAQPDGA
ncbi:MAG: hypothetical protein GXP54_05625 [Deltaproteobacteria bacterium]|nr:hypothetical protein [Deltaproteobacteria bacterium]